jgi:3-hydroxyisobutyrate dehydrogenase-like beta-hydroxyacid dehydrogenase
MEEKMELGFIGLGIMGMPMARHLLKAGHSLTVFSHTSSKAQQLGKEGAKVAASPADLGSKCDLVFLCVGNTEHMQEMAVGPQGLLQGVRKGATVVDCSTVSPSASRRVAGQFAAKGVAFLDAPCTGSKAGAEGGNLTFMIGGDKAVFERIREYFQPMGKKIYYVGSNGMGLHAKLSQNLVLALTYQGMCEGFVLAAKAGVPPELMYDIIQNSAARAGIIEYKKNAVFNGNWDTNFSLKWMYKDMSLMLQSGQELGVPLPGLAVVHELFGASIARGHGDDDYAAVITLLEDWAGTKVRVKAEASVGD